jgi:hypothetical protein
LAWRYERDPASIDWRHLGRLLGIGFRCAFLLKTKDELGSYGIFPYGRPSAIACRGQGQGRGSFRIFSLHPYAGPLVDRGSPHNYMTACGWAGSCVQRLQMLEGMD